MPGVESRIVDMQTGKEAPWDGKSSGELEVSATLMARAFSCQRFPVARFDTPAYPSRSVARGCAAPTTSPRAATRATTASG